MKKFFKLMLSLALTLSVVVPATSNVNAEEVKEGVTVSANVSYPEVDTKYQATFVVDSKKLGEDVTNVQLEGGFQFLKASEDHYYIENNGNTSQINFYTAYEYEPGMYPIGGCGNTNRTDMKLPA